MTLVDGSGGARRVVISGSEKRVLDELLRDGAENPVIARRMGVTLDTVKSHMRSLLRKTGTATRTGLAVAIMRGRVRLDVDHRRGGRVPPVRAGAG